MIEANDKAIRKLAWFAQEKLWHEAVLRPEFKYNFEPGFGVADCVGDLDSLVVSNAVDKAFQWHRHLYGPWYEQNQAYTVPGMEAVVQLINERGEVELDQNLEREDTTKARSLIDEMLVGDSAGDSAWFDRILNSEKFSEARTQLRELKNGAETRKLRKERDDSIATSAPPRLGPVDQAIADNTYSMPVQRAPEEAPLPKTEYRCGQCEKKLFLTRADVLRCDGCGWRGLRKPDAKKFRTYEAR